MIEDALSALRGSIPACAGEPIEFAGMFGSVEVYPRVCGGTEATLKANSYSNGLSPRVRGNRFRLYACSACVWSIPACAGEPV